MRHETGECKTKTAIAAAWRKKVRRQPPDTITIKILADACGVTRATFYRHFRNLFEVMEWSFQQALDRTMRKCLEADDLESAVEQLAKDVAADYPLVRQVLASKWRVPMEALFLRATHTILDAALRKRFAALPIPRALGRGVSLFRLRDAGSPASPCREPNRNSANFLRNALRPVDGRHRAAFRKISDTFSVICKDIRTAL